MASEASTLLPQWIDVDGKVDRGEPLTALERFIYEFDTAEPEQHDKFQRGLIAVLWERDGADRKK